MYNARTLILCVIGLCCTAAFADWHPTSRSASAVEPNLFSPRTSWAPPLGDLAQPQLGLLTPDILPGDFVPHRASSRTEPFDLSAALAPTEDISAKWRELQSRIFADEKTIATCRSNESTCSPATRRFLSIVNLGRRHEGRARLGWLNRAVNMSIRAANDWSQYGDTDYWASPLQTLDSEAGDCEDYAVVKYVALRELGVSADDLRIVIVQDSKRLIEHAVVTVRYEQKWLILDNRTMAILSTEDARNYLPLFALNSTRPMTVATADR